MFNELVFFFLNLIDYALNHASPMNNHDEPMKNRNKKIHRPTVFFNNNFCIIFYRYFLILNSSLEIFIIPYTILTSVQFCISVLIIYSRQLEYDIVQVFSLTDYSVIEHDRF